MKYPIECEQFYGMSHSGGVFGVAKGEVELTDEEVAKLVQLMREKNTSDVEELELEETEPDIYDTLYDACDKMCDKAAFDEAWLGGYWEAWCGDMQEMVDYDIYDMMYYCEKNCGFVYEGDENEDEDYDESKMAAFRKWLDEYLHTAPDADVLKFFEENMTLLVEDYEFVDPSAVDYDVTVVIPQPIIDMAFPKK